MRFEKYKVTEVFRAFVNSSIKIMIKYNKYCFVTESWTISRSNNESGGSALII